MLNNVSSRDAPIAQFIALTGASQDVARLTLEACNWNLQLAINMFMDGAKSQVVASRAPAKTHSTTKNRVKVPAQTPTPASSNENVRAPIAPTKEVLVKDYISDGTGRFTNWRDQQTAEGQFIPNSKTSAGNSTGTALDQLFRPPVELLFVGNLEAAKKEAEKQKKWLLVNIQAFREFECLVLNRDVWAHRDVKKLIEERFIFWQMEQNSVEGRKYVNFYHVSKFLFPHISILDPRTGEKMLSWHKVNANEFINDVASFITSNPSPGASKAAVTAAKASKPRTVLEQSEDAQLKAAIEASLKLNESTKISTTMPSFKEGAANLDVKPNTLAGAWKQYLGPEGGVKVRLAIRFPDGKRHTVTFPTGTKVKALLLYIAEQFGFEANKYDLNTMYPKKSLTAAACDEMATLEAAGVKARDTLYLQPK